MPRPRPAAARGRAGGNGIDAVEAFSRGDAIDRAWMGWGALRVLSRQDWAPGASRNDGRVANMERLLLVLDGALEADCGALGRHRVDAGGVLWMGAGHGMESRVANASAVAPLRLLECWLQPDRVNAAPAVAVRGTGGGDACDAWSVLAASAADELDALPLRQRARLMAARLRPGATLGIPAGDGGRCWLEVLEGAVTASAGAAAGPGFGPLAAGDGLGWTAGQAGAPTALSTTGNAPAWVLLFQLPG